MKYFSRAKNLFWPDNPRSNSLPQLPQELSMRADIEKWKAVYSLACEMIVLMMQIKQTEHEQAARLRILLPHKDRLSALSHRNHGALCHFENILMDSPTNEDAQFDVERLGMRAIELQNALRAVDEAIESKAEEINALENKLNQLMQETADLSEIKEAVSDPAQQITEDSVLTEDMMVPSIVAGLEYEHMEMDNAQFESRYEAFFEDRRSYTSQEIDEMQRDEMASKFRELKTQYHHLQKDDADANRDEVEALARQIHELADELCLRGLACKDGSIWYDESTVDEVLSEKCPNRARAADPCDDFRSVREVGHPYEGPKLFSNISDSSIEKPRSRCEYQDERWLTGAEIDELMQKIEKRVSGWQDNVENKTVLSEFESSDSRTTSEGGLRSLTSVAVGESLEPGDEIDEPMDKLRRSMIDVWGRRTGRMFTHLPQEGQSAHPRYAASHA